MSKEIDKTIENHIVSNNLNPYFASMIRISVQASPLLFLL